MGDDFETPTGDDFEPWLESYGMSHEELLALGFGLTADKQLARDACDPVVDQVLSMFWHSQEPSTPKISGFRSLMCYKFGRAIGRLRERAKRLSLVDLPVEHLGVADYSDPERALQSSDLLEVFRDVLDGVQVGGADVYEVLYLVSIKALKYDVVAERLGVSKSTVSRAKELAFTLIRERRPDLEQEI